MFILRHAWLNLWDKHMTTGRINQVTITLGSYPRTHTHYAFVTRMCICMRASFPSLRKEPHNRMHASLFPTFVFVSSSWKHFVFVSEMRPRIVPNSRGAPAVGQASFWAVLLLSFSAGLCVALAQVSAQSRFASSPLLDGKSTAATWLHWPIWRLHTTSLMLWELPIWGINLN